MTVYAPGPDKVVLPQRGGEINRELTSTPGELDIRDKRQGTIRTSGDTETERGKIFDGFDFSLMYNHLAIQSYPMASGITIYPLLSLFFKRHIDCYH